MLNITQFRQLIIKSSLNDLLLYSQEAEELLVFTCATESLGGTYLHQVNGPALGIYQMEPTTYNDIWQNYIYPNGALALRLFANFNISSVPSEDRLIYDLRFATAMARIHFRRIKSPLPLSNNLDSIWDYYKQYYNTLNGNAHNKEESIRKYHDFVQLHR